MLTMLWLGAAMAAVTVDGGVVRVDGAVIAEGARGAVELDGQVWVLVGGAVEVWAGGARTRRIPAPDAVGIWSDGTQVWVTVPEWRALPVERLATTVLTPAGSTPVADAAVVLPPAGAVTRVEPGAVVVDRSLPVGTEVRFFGARALSEVALDGAGRTTRSVEQLVGTGRVHVQEADRSLVDLGRGARVAVGDRVEVEPDAYTYPVAPARLGGIGEAGVVLRPLLGLETVGVGFLNEAWASWAFTSPWYVQARVSPLGLGFSTDGNPLSIAGYATGGYDSRYFSVGLGAGWSMLNGSAVNGGAALDDGGVSADFRDVKGAFAVVQEARLGARDGLSVGVRNTFLLVPQYTYVYDTTSSGYGETTPTVTEDGQAFTYGGLAMNVQVPTGDRTDLFADWTFGEAGALWVEGGVSTWLRGNGDRGSVAVSVAAGYGEIDAYVDERYTSLYGPMVSVGGRYRF